MIWSFDGARWCLRCDDLVAVARLVGRRWRWWLFGVSRGRSVSLAGGSDDSCAQALAAAGGELDEFLAPEHALYR